MSSLPCNLVYTGCTVNVVPGTLNKYVFSSRLSLCCSVSARRKEVHIDCSKAVCLENSTPPKWSMEITEYQQNRPKSRNLNGKVGSNESIYDNTVTLLI